MLNYVRKDVKNMQEKFCESCGAPFTDGFTQGTEADGSLSEDYCNFCYENGTFTNPNMTLEEMIAFCTDLMVKEFGFTREDALEQCNEGIPGLKRWKTA